MFFWLFTFLAPIHFNVITLAPPTLDSLLLPIHIFATFERTPNIFSHGHVHVHLDSRLTNQLNTMTDLRGLSTSLNGLKMALNQPQSHSKSRLSPDSDLHEHTSSLDDLSEEDRQLVLEKELEQVRSVNDACESVVQSLSVTEFNLEVCPFFFLLHLCALPVSNIIYRLC